MFSTNFAALAEIICKDDKIHEKHPTLIAKLTSSNTNEIGRSNLEKKILGSLKIWESSSSEKRQLEELNKILLESGLATSIPNIQKHYSGVRFVADSDPQTN
ncbi:hypothetical protein Fcan01_18190 [Folsomia candida]|uniref:Uncharacterized protein n=1 Tax=Folsomia candida TaxID=158441 RepID=A0A226DP56_FOLCA|nr:hypothetical protein Fcan01_18190 [Folsomia candida]